MRQPFWKIALEAVVCSLVIGALLFELTDDSKDEMAIMDKAVKWSAQAKRRFEFSTQAVASKIPTSCGTATATTISGVSGTCANVATNWGQSSTCCSADPALTTAFTDFDGFCSNYACKALFVNYQCTFACKASGSFPCQTEATELAAACTTACPELITAGYAPSDTTVLSWLRSGYGNTTDYTSASCTKFIRQSTDASAPTVDSLTANSATTTYAFSVDRSINQYTLITWVALVTSSAVPSVSLTWLYSSATTNAFSTVFPTAAWTRVNGTQWKGTLVTNTSAFVNPDGVFTATATATNGASGTGTSAMTVTVTSTGAASASLGDQTLCPVGSTTSASSTLSIPATTTSAGTLDCRCNGACNYVCQGTCTITIASFVQSGTNTAIENAQSTISGLVNPSGNAAALSLKSSPVIFDSAAELRIAQVYSIVADAGSSIQFKAASLLNVLVGGNLGLTGLMRADSTNSVINGLITVKEGSYSMTTGTSVTNLAGKLITRNSAGLNGFDLSGGSIIKGAGTAYMSGGPVNVNGAVLLSMMQTTTSTTTLPTSRKFVAPTGNIIYMCNAVTGVTTAATTLNSHQLLVNTNAGCILSTAVKTAAWGAAVPASVTTDANNAALTLVGVDQSSTYTVGANSALTFDQVSPTGTRMMHFSGNLVFDATATVEVLVAPGSAWPTGASKVALARFLHTANGCPTTNPAAMTTRALTNETCPTGRSCFVGYEKEATGTTASNWCRIMFYVALKCMAHRDGMSRKLLFAAGVVSHVRSFLAPHHQKHSKLVDGTLLLLTLLIIKGEKAQAESLGKDIVGENLLDALSDIMGKDLPIQTRTLAEEMLLSVVHTLPDLTDRVREATSVHAVAITKRKRADQEEARRKMQERKQQQQFMEMMAMREMMGMGMDGGGMPGMGMDM
eukprot:NODE_189_length_2986_cov_218.030038_g175_i0.p1 GENE.NODE_189_length_2986_cov_218.030038_g175_i0~~NODE_189_length_2986_cov_218.030038_g175_i0.p1  ORF type:complete len:909 (+),score=265.97 NODE_189_length_2986_cov_218.030038_g175_i0:63-2789(+)